MYFCWFFGFRLAIAGIVALSANVSALMGVGLMTSAAFVSFTVNAIYRFLESRWQQVTNLIMEALLVVIIIIALIDVESTMDING